MNDEVDDAKRIIHDSDPNELRCRLLGSPLYFTRIFYELRTENPFMTPDPIGRECHYVTVFKALKKVFDGDINRLLLNIPPGHGKSEMLVNFIAWYMARYPDSNFLYISYSHMLAAAHTYKIRQIMSLPAYKSLFGISIKHDSSAKDDFATTAGGRIRAFGGKGPVTGMDAGLPFVKRPSGGVIIDDIHKPDEVHSDTVRQKVKDNHLQTICPRPRSPIVPIIFLGHRLHEDDVPANLIEGYDGHKWDKVVLPALDDAGNVLCPSIIKKEQLLMMQEKSPYVFWSQYQQVPTPSGGAIYKQDNFVLLPFEPDILFTFIVVDCAETEKTYNDATVFSFFGGYKIKDNGVQTDIIGLHCLDCVEIWVEPKDLEPSFMQFFSGCMTHPVKPRFAAIEKKSTGTTLCSILKDRRGLSVLEVDRTRSSGSKTDRFLRAQPYVNERLVSFTAGAKHAQMCIEHMAKITANQSHMRDDIADTFADAIQLVLIDKTISWYDASHNHDALASKFHAANQTRDEAFRKLWQSK